jgi:hypothetical protein
MTIADSLTLLNTTKNAIKTAIEAKGVTVGSVPFSQYATKIGNISTGGGGGGTPASLEWTQDYYDAVYAAGPGSWYRPEWRALPSTLTSSQILIGLYAIHPDNSNFCSVLATGDYTVDWGDGVVENITSEYQADHTYDYSNVVLDGTDAPVTFSSADSVITRNSHGFQNGNLVSFWNISSSPEILEGTKYYVISATNNTFKISSSLNGSAITLTTSGSATLSRFKQAIVTVTAQAGSTVTSVSLNAKHPSQPSTTYVVGWLDVIVGNPSLAFMGIGPMGPSTVNHKNLLERIRITDLGTVTSLAYGFLDLKNLKVMEFPAGTNSVTDLSNAFNTCINLRTITLLDTSNVTSMVGTFSSCSNLETIPLLDTSSVTSANSLFSNCQNLKKIPALDLSNITTSNGLFTGCNSLEYVPALDLSSSTTISTMFNGCFNLSEITLTNLSNVTDASSAFYNCDNLKSASISGTTLLLTTVATMFYNCYRLETVSLFNTVGVTNFTQMFYNCYRLKSIPPFNTAAVSGINMVGMFYGCASLESIPLLNTTNITSMSTMFQNCYSLQDIPLLDTAKVTTFANAFNGCHNLQNIPALSLLAAGTFTTTFSSCFSLKRIEAKEFKASFNISNCSLSATALNEIYTNLPTLARTITVTGNYGTASDTPSIATAKGWTVTG